MDVPVAMKTRLLMVSIIFVLLCGVVDQADSPSGVSLRHMRIRAHFSQEAKYVSGGF